MADAICLSFPRSERGSERITASSSRSRSGWLVKWIHDFEIPFLVHERQRAHAKQVESTRWRCDERPEKCRADDAVLNCVNLGY
jgi:mRNA deadenylase 3'-5' endonuclease subunit Ccr4